MKHEIQTEDLSAFLDGELPPEQMDAVRSHLAGCASCREKLELLLSGSEAFKKSTTRKAPAGLSNAILSRTQRAPKEKAALSIALAAGVAVLILFSVGRLFKSQISMAFNQVMGMVSGAATSVGAAGH